MEVNYAPSSTYRLQLNKNFPLRAAHSIVEYLHALGIEACYLSPILRARPGSLHGYDITDHGQLNPELGTEDDLRELAAELAGREMGIILDIVPNHMCITDPANGWWWDVLENGASSPYARYFDIDWQPPKEELLNRVLLPTLGDQFGVVLESGQINVRRREGVFELELYGMPLPLTPDSWVLILQPALKMAILQLGQDDEPIAEFESIIAGLSNLPLRTETDSDRVRERYREKEILKRRLAELMDRSEEIRAAVDASVEEINGKIGDSASFDRLEQLLAQQVYRLAYWRVAVDEINYRRFFDINELAAIRVEDEDVFQAVHASIFKFIRHGWVRGLRVDHPDGLYDPQDYFKNLQESCMSAWKEASNGVPASRFFVVAEKILIGDEELRPGWRIEGTTGYGFLNILNGLYVSSSSRRSFRRLFEKFAERTETVNELTYQCKKLVLQLALSSELNVLARRLDRISEFHRYSRDYTLQSQRTALEEIIAYFPIYRTYVVADSNHLDQEDERHIRWTVSTAVARNPAISQSLFVFLQHLLLLQHPDGITEEQRRERVAFVLRLQQLTGPVMAKSIEDTLFYRYFPLASLCEVGSEPRSYGTGLRTFHEKNAIRLKRYPHALLGTSTHDTKRGEDVRARINVLSEIPAEWYRMINQWREMSRPFKTLLGAESAPSAADEYLIYQTLVGAWPFTPPDREAAFIFTCRIQEYMRKAVREAKIHTSWVNPNEAYEKALDTFIESLLSLESENRFLAAFIPFQQSLARAGILNSLSQLVLKIASPGIPDFYQGCEGWNFSLVDPDNRHPVDFARLRTLLDSVRAIKPEDLEPTVKTWLETPDDGLIKLHVTQAALHFRRRNRALFLQGEYIPLQVDGPRRGHVIAFARKQGSARALVVCGRFFMALGAGDGLPLSESAWESTVVWLPRSFAGIYSDVLTAGRHEVAGEGKRVGLPVGRLLRLLPAALLVRG